MAKKTSRSWQLLAGLTRRRCGRKFAWKACRFLAGWLVCLGAVHGSAQPRVIGWGANTYGQAQAPPGLSNVVAIAAGVSHSLVLRGDGTVVAWGNNAYGQTNVPPGLSNVVSIS